MARAYGCIRMYLHTRITRAHYIVLNNDIVYYYNDICIDTSLYIINCIYI